MSPQDRHSPEVTVETEVDQATAEGFYRLYTATFGDLATRSVARQTLHRSEFMAAMEDPRVDKYLAHDRHGEPVAMCTLTRHLETVPWISPDYFTHHYPEYAARDAIYYLGFILVAHRHRRAQVFGEMVRLVARTLVDRRAMCAYDICAFNIERVGLADSIRTLLHGVAEIDVRPVDTQVYFHAVPVAPGR